MNREEKLPKWAQKRISDLEFNVKYLTERLKNAEKANEITSQMDWFTIGFHTKEIRTLYFLDRDEAVKVATIGEGAILLLGRKKPTI